MDAYLDKFSKKMKSAAKDSETLSLEEAEWHLTALENYTFCDASILYEDIIVDTIYTTISTINGNISLYDLNSVYNENRTEIIKKYNSLIGDDKIIYMINSKIVNGDSKDGKADIATITYMFNNFTISNPYRFDSTDYWYDFDTIGKCDIYEGQCEGRDATTEMDKKLRNNIPGYACLNGRVYFTNIEGRYTDPYSYPCIDSLSPSPHGDCLHVGTSTGYICLSPDDLNWYLDKILSIIRDDEAQTGKLWINVHLYQNYFVSVPAEAYFWSLEYTLGEIHCTPTTPSY